MKGNEMLSTFFGTFFFFMSFFFFFSFSFFFTFTNYKHTFVVFKGKENQKKPKKKKQNPKQNQTKPI